MNYFCWKILLITLSLVLLLDTCLGQYSSSYNTYRSHSRGDDDKKPYEFNDAELTAIQAIVAFREVIGELLSKVGLNIPSIASIITRSDLNHMKAPIRVTEAVADSSIKSGGLGSALLRGMALSLPLLIPMATQIRRMSTDPPYVPPIPFIPDPYYNRALHRRRGRRSVRTDDDYYRIKQIENILLRIDAMDKKFGKN